MGDLTRAPWTPSQVDALNAFQRAGLFHPFTCGGEHDDGGVVLTATENGWVCQLCDYTQDWAHAFMLTPAASERPRA